MRGSVNLTLRLQIGPVSKIVSKHSNCKERKKSLSMKNQLRESLEGEASYSKINFAGTALG